MMNRHTGTPMTRPDHIAQSVGDILTTPIGTRVLNRDYGSELFDLVDSPANAVGRLRLLAATADAIARWEPRVTLDAASLSVSADGAATLTLEMTDLSDGVPLVSQVSL